MFPLACPTASVPKAGYDLLVGLLTEGRGNGGNAKAVMGEGAKSTNLQRCTAMAVVSSIAGVQFFFSFDTHVDPPRDLIHARRLDPHTRSALPFVQCRS